MDDYFYTGIQPASSILPRPSMTPGEGSQQDCNINNILAGTTAAMGVLNIVLAVIVTLVICLCSPQTKITISLLQLAID